MDIEHTIKEAKTLIVEKRAEEATELLTNALAFIQSSEYETTEQDVKLVLEAAIQENLGDAKIIDQKDQEALSHLLMALTQLQTLESVSEQSAIDPLFRVYRKMAGAFNRLGQQFESEKYLRKAGDIKGSILKKELYARLKAKGYSFQEDVRVIESEASPVDILAEKGSLFKKKRIAIWFAMDDSEIDTISFITRGYAKYAKSRYILLLMGQTTIPNLDGVRIISSIDDIKL
ncbi:MAG: hypothetical protein ACW98I_07330 [Candidatus Hodarchaeales archaeon]|jgi:hypothetical protein